MTAHAIILQHVLAEDAGLLTPILHDYGYTVTMIETPIHSVTTTQALDADLLIALGGPIGVEDRDLHPYLHDELDALGTRMADNAPTLGICLGAQLMAHALGADVTSTGRAEIGYGPLTLTPEGHHSPSPPSATHPSSTGTATSSPSPLEPPASPKPPATPTKHSPTDPTSSHSNSTSKSTPPPLNGGSSPTPTN